MTDADDGATGDVVHNDADTEFAQMMIVHHQGAVEMSELAIEKADTEDVRALAQSISEAQGPEIDTMTGWLEAWGEDVPDETATEDMGDMGDMDHSGMDMNGMDQAEAMEELEGVSGTEFDRRFLELMIAHHEGAVEMAQTEMDEGENADATGLAQQIVEAQEAEILSMQEMLDDL
jgi:uncharacterized protein (DUF305 family)